jgi:hypothetical protein
MHVTDDANDLVPVQSIRRTLREPFANRIIDGKVASRECLIDYNSFSGGPSGLL